MEARKMKQEQVQRFKVLFEQERRNLMYTQSIMNEAFHFHESDLPDTNDLTSSELERSMRIRLRNRETLYLRKIEEALSRIANGSFGECEECGEEIGHKRLMARPTTTFCVNCKEEQENREGHHIDGLRHKSLGIKLRLA